MDAQSRSSAFALLIIFSQGLIILSTATTITNGFLGGNFLGDLVCEFTDCGNGKCKAASKGLGGFECECDPGWKTHKAAPYTFPACILPNCSVDLACDNKASAPVAPASILLSQAKTTLCPDCNNKASPQASVASPAPTNSLASPTSDDDACHMIWCGEGKCKANENGKAGYHCQCHNGATNMFNNASWACFKPCSLGSDCYSIPTCPQNLQSPPPNTVAPPPVNNGT
ncbi:hypothetical protein LINGRAHAP2_LOCUS7293 [Linum grandiflorum]